MRTATSNKKLDTQAHYFGSAHFPVMSKDFIVFPNQHRLGLLNSKSGSNLYPK